MSGKSVLYSTCPMRLFFACFIILLLALVVRLGYWQDSRGYALRGDEPDYVLPAQTLVRVGEYVDTFIVPGRTWTRVPLTSLVFAGSFLFVPDPLAASAAGDDAALMQPRYDALNLLQIAFSLVTVALIMALTARAFPAAPRRAAVIAGLIAALYPPLAASSAQLALSETTAIMLAFAAVYVLSLWHPGLRTLDSLAVAIAGGGMLGLAALARPVAFTFLPFAWLWLFVVHRAYHQPASQPAPLRRYGKPLVSATLMTAACLLAISPATLYNYRHYGRFLLLDSASAHNLWAYHNYRGDDLTARLQALPNPADRLSLIISEGTRNILEHPDKALRDTFFNFGYFWHLESNSAVLLNPWDMTQRDPDVPDLLHADAALLLVGLAAMAGLAGVGLRRPTDAAGRTLLLSNFWLLASVLLGLVIPYDARFRLPAAPSIIVLAAGLLALTNWHAVFSRRAFAILQAYPRTALVTAALCLWVVLGAYSPNVPPLLRSLYQAWRGDLAFHSGDYSTALGRYALAQQAFPGFYWPYRHAAEALQQGPSPETASFPEQARALYNRTLALNPDDPYGILGLADLAAQHPQWELTPQERKWLDRDEALWRGNPWNSLHPWPTLSIDVGNPGDIGYILGFNYAEEPSPGLNYRWSRGRATVRLPLPPIEDQPGLGGAYSSVTLRMSAPALGPSRPMPVRISINGRPPTTLNVPPGWTDYPLQLPLDASDPSHPGQTLTLDITSPTLSPASLLPGSDDTRSLGVGIDSVKLNR
ncbi:MAG: tetratricopeptide repeat protein [Chloroflexia bacterium]